MPLNTRPSESLLFRIETIPPRVRPAGFFPPNRTIVKTVDIRARELQLCPDSGLRPALRHRAMAQQFSREGGPLPKRLRTVLSK